jgi:hypothetical protein
VLLEATSGTDALEAEDHLALALPSAADGLANKM